MSDLTPIIPTLPAFDVGAVVSTAPPGLRAAFSDDGTGRFEAAGDYAGLLAALVEAVAPRDAIEWIWVKDMADVSWEARRLRDAKAAVLTLARRWAVDDARLGGLGEADAPEIGGLAYRRKLEDMERLDRLITIAGARRDAMFRDLEQRRDRIRAMRDRAIAADAREAVQAARATGR